MSVDPALSSSCHADTRQPSILGNSASIPGEQVHDVFLWIKLVEEHSRSGSMESQSDIYNLAQRIPNLNEPNPELERLKGTIQEVARVRKYDPSLLTHARAALDSLQKKYPALLN